MVRVEDEWRVLWRPCPAYDAALLDERLRGWGFPARLLRASVAALEPVNASMATAIEDMSTYLEELSNSRAKVPGRILTGGNGVGKTHLAVAVARELLQRGVIRNARFYDVAMLLAQLRHGDRDEQSALLKAASTTHLLVLDDLGAERASAWVSEQLGMIINHRWSDDLPLIATSNVSLDAACETLGLRSASRLQQMVGLVDIQAPDYREREVV